MKPPPVTIHLEVVRELLRRGAVRLNPPGAWLQGEQAATADGESTRLESPDARHWDILGALRLEAQRMYGGQFEGPAQQLYAAAMSKMAEAIVEHLDCRRVTRHPASAVAAWNDAAERTQDQVLNLFALAA